MHSGRTVMGGGGGGATGRTCDGAICVGLAQLPLPHTNGEAAGGRAGHAGALGAVHTGVQCRRIRQPCTLCCVEAECSACSALALQAPRAGLVVLRHMRDCSPQSCVRTHLSN